MFEGDQKEKEKRTKGVRYPLFWQSEQAAAKEAAT